MKGKIKMTLLNYREQGEGNALVLLHGLFGSLSNLNVLAQALKENYRVIQVDLRNHGDSFWSDDMNLSLMAQDVIALCDALKIEQFSLIGHSMGGKTAMAVTQLVPQRVEKLVVLDIAPVAYDMRNNGHDKTLHALNAVLEHAAQSRNDAMKIMMEILNQPLLVGFLLKSFNNETKNWKFNLRAINHNIQHISDWQTAPAWDKPTLFVKGEKSHYILPEYREAILSQFPNSKLNIIANAGHNVHTEKPESTLRAIARIL